MVSKATEFDISEYLDDEETIAGYLSEIITEGDTAHLLSAIGDIAKARGMSKIASDSGLGRESLYKALNSKAKPRFDTIFKVLASLGVNITFSAKIKSRTVSRKRKAMHGKISIRKIKTSAKDEWLYLMSLLKW